MNQNFAVNIPEMFNAAGLIDRHADNSEKVAIYWEDEAGNTATVRYRELRERSNRLANGLIRRGVGKEDKVMVLLPRIPEAYITYLAVLKIGAVVLPGSEMLKSSDIAYRIKHAEVGTVICHAAIVEQVDAVKAACGSLRNLIIVGGEKPGWEPLSEVMAGQSEELETAATKASDIAFLSYTSGTTGGPKGVLHAHSWAKAHLEIAGTYWFDAKENEIAWATAAPGWAKWVWTPFISILGSGATAFVYSGRFDAKKYLSLLEKYRVNVLCCTPTEYRLMAKVDGLEAYHLDALRSAVSAGEPLNREVIDIFREYFNVTVRDGYGQTENTLLVSNLAGDEIKPGSMGKPSPGHRVTIIDEDGAEVGVGVIGDIAVHKDTPTLFKGYYKDPERTSKAYRGDWYLTGDRARKDEDGYFWFEGRSDDIIISAGYTIGPFEVEDALVKHPSVAECAVVASPDEVRGHIVKAFVILRRPQDASPELVEELQNHVKAVTAPYKYPREIEFVTELPKTSSGKIRRVELRQAEQERKRR